VFAPVLMGRRNGEGLLASHTDFGDLAWFPVNQFMPPALIRSGRFQMMLLMVIFIAHLVVILQEFCDIAPERRLLIPVQNAFSTASTSANTFLFANQTALVESVFIAFRIHNPPLEMRNPINREGEW
jgi:hypothetical protein